MKECAKCGPKDESEFSWKDKSRGTLQSYCKACQKTMKDAHYVANKALYKERAKARTRRIKDEIDKLKRKPCKDCGRKEHPCAMDFDHLGEKTDDVSRLIHRDKASLDKVLAEISKCDLLCAVCHRKRTFFRQTGIIPIV